MATATLLKNTFSAGELSPLMVARSDFARYPAGAQTLENWVVLLQGGVRTRYGTRYVVATKFPTRLSLVRPFEASGTEAYVLEVGHLYVRFCKNGAQIQSLSVPVEVATPYEEGQLRGLRTAQANDVLILAHGSHPPAQLSRTSDTVWSYKPIVFDPPPLYEAGITPAATLTPSATTGSVTLTASAGVFLRADVDRQIQAGDARAVITAYTSDTVVTATVLSAFADTDPIAAGGWMLLRSPVANCKPEKAQPVNALITLDLELTQPNETELISDGTFAGGLGAWTDLSGPVLATGQHDGLDNATSLTDTSENFIARGVQPGHIVHNTTNGCRGVVERVAGITRIVFTTAGLEGGSEQDFDINDAYEVRGTGGIDARNGKLYLVGNANGIGWTQRAVTTVAGVRYRVAFEVSEGPISAQVGSASGLSDLFAEGSFDQGNTHSLTFTAAGATSYVQFRNNQPAAGAIDNVSCKRYSIEGWHTSDVGKYVQLNQGLVRITAYTSGSRVTGQILRELTSEDAALAGAWSLTESAWSATNGYPSTVLFFEGRLYFGGSAHFPQTIWASAVDDFFNFFQGANAKDALEIPIVDSAGNITLNQIRWMMPGENLLVGTTHAEYRLTGPTDGAFSATDLPLVRLQSTFGSDTVQPVRVGQSLLFAQRQGSKVRQMAFEPDVASSFLARDLTNLSGHLLTGERILELSYQPEPLPVVWAVRSDGQLLGLTYDLLEEVIAWHRQVTEGVIESHAVVPHATANSYQLWLSVQRTIDGSTVRYLEYVDDQATMRLVTPVEGVVPSWQGLTVDSAVTYSFATPSATLTGLGHLEGATVAIVGDGAVYPAQEVSGGQVVLSAAVTTAWAGLPYTCTGETLPLDLLLRTGTVQDMQKGWLKLFVRVYQSVGVVLNGEQIPFRQSGQFMDEGVPLFTGKRAIVAPAMEDGEATVTFVQPQPLPATLLSLSGVVELGGL